MSNKGKVNTGKAASRMCCLSGVGAVVIFFAVLT